MATEKRLIDAHDLWSDIMMLPHNGDMVSSEEVEQTIKDAPTVDAVEVVRCKDCKQWGGVAFGNVCRRWSAPLAGMKNCTTPDVFCSYGERRKPDGLL